MFHIVESWSWLVELVDNNKHLFSEKLREYIKAYPEDSTTDKFPKMCLNTLHLLLHEGHKYFDVSLFF